jgi:uncharacterized protein (TIGR02145 family)
MRKYAFLVSGLILCLGLSAQFQRSTVTDVDGNEYNTVKIGEYWWMASNLKTKHFQNGDELTVYPDSLFPDYATSVSAKDGYTTGGSQNDGAIHFAYPNRDAANMVVYGLNYTWWAATDTRGLCPEGWSLPDTTLWYTMVRALGVGVSQGSSVGWTTVGKYLKSASYWQTSESASAVVDSIGFNALPSGDLSAWGYMYYEQQARFWTPNLVMADGSGMGRRYIAFHYDSDDLFQNNYRSNSCISIRCVKKADATAVQVGEKTVLEMTYLSGLDKLALKNIPAGAVMSIYSINGIRLRQKTGNGESLIYWNTAELGHGTYILSVQGGAVGQQLKFIK